MSASPAATTSAYVRLKIALDLSAHSQPGQASRTMLVKKVEVPRTLAFSGLCRKLTLLYGVGKDAPADCMPFTLLIARGAQAATLPDEVVCRSEVLEREKLNWETIEDQATWTKLTSHTEKYLLKIIPLPPTTVQSTTAVASSSSSATPAPATTPIPRHLLVQHVIPRKAPGPWPKFAPVPGTLPVIVYSGESEHEWEMLEEGEFEKMELEQLECKSEKPVANAKPAGKAATVVSKPNRTIPAELYAKLKGANLGANATPTPTTTVTFSVNKQMYTVNSPSPTLKLIEYLRYEIGITGSKIGCGEGGCGACTVVLSKTNAQTGLPVQFSTKACLHPVAALDGWSITTVEGLGNEHTGLHPIQQAMIDNWATQCGYCTPGFVMSMYGLLINNPKPTTAEIEDRFDGNLCRCTGYRPIFKAMRTLVPPSGEQKNAAGGCACGSGGKCGCSSHAAPTKSTCDSGSSSSTSAMKACGKGEGLDCSSGAKSACNSQGITCGSASSKGCGTVDMEDLLYDASNPRHNVNPFPHALVEYNHTESLKSSVEKGVRYVADSQAIWFQPQDLSDVYAILAQYQATEVVKLVVGNSSIGVTKYYTQNPLTDQPTIFINTAGLSELTSTQLVANQGLLLGASVTLTTLISLLDQTISSAPLVTTSWVALSRHIKMVANTGVRNVASWTGNMMIAKSHSEFPSDLMTIFAAHGATITVSSSSGTPKTMSVLQFDSYTMLPGEIVISLLIPFTPANWQFDSYKVRARHQNAHPIINAGYGFTVVKGQTTISAVQMVIGGLTETGIFQPQQTMAYLTGKSLSAATLAGALAVLDKEAVPGDRPDPNSTFYISSPVYRHSLVLSTFYKFFLSQMSAAGVAVPDGDTSAFEVFNRGVSSGAEVYNTGADPLAPVGRAIPKLESAGQVSGGAKYIDDMQLPPNGLWASYVYSKVAVGTIESFDPTAALAMPGVFQFISAADLVGKFANDCGSFPGDEEIFCSGSVTASGQALGLILADTRAHADAAAAAVVVNWKTLTPAPVPIVSIQDALSAVPPSVFPDNKYMQNPPDITSGDFETAFKNSPHQVSGTNSSAGQTHFFMETQTCYAIPDENNGLYVHSSSQGPTDIRAMVMRVTGLPANKVTVSTRRTGGAFGGKLSRSHPIASAVSVAACLTNRPIKAQCSRTADMDMWGKRPEMYITYQVGFDNNGKVLALSVVFYQHGGHTYEANFGSMSMCLEENTLVAGVGGKGILAKNVKKGMELIGRGGNVTVADVTTNPADELYTFVTRSGTYHVTAEHQITLRCGVTPTVSFHKPTTKKGHWGLRVTWLNSQTGRWRVVRFPIVSFIDPQSVRADEMTLDDSDSDDSDDSSDSDDSDSTSDGSLHDFSEMSDAASTSSINARERVEVDAMEISDCPQPLSGTREQLLAFGRKFLADVPADQKVAVGELFEVSAKQLYDSMLWRCAAGDSPVVTGVRVPLPERVTIDEPAPSSSAPLPVVTVEQRHLDAFAACSQVAGSGRVLQCFTLRALGAGRYRQAAVGDSVAVVYQLHCPLLAEEGTQSLNSSGRKSFTFLRMDQAHESLKVDVASARLVITELNPVCHDPDSRDPPETLTKAYDAVCMSSIDTVRRLLGKGRVLAFGSYCRQRWLQFAEQSGVSYEKRDVQQAGQRVPTLRFADGIEVVFAPHPSCWNPAFMVLILAAVSYVHGCPDAVTMRALSECGVRSFERDPILDIRKRTATEEGVMAFNTINIEIEGEQWADKRYALIGGMLTHNCLLWSDGAYFVPAFKAHGVTCRTNTPSNTAMRGPGAFKSIWQMESVMERIAFELNMAPDAVRAVNFYTENQLTPYGQPVTNITMQKVWAQLQAQSNYAAQKAAVAAFNAKNKWRKQGVHMTAVKYGITDPGNQVGILINVMQDDGTIIVTHTGVELGQGINSKVAQTIAYALGLPDVSLIIIDDNATNIVANGSQTGGSATSESACAAALLACTDLNNRLAPVKKANPGVTWQALIPLAAAALVNLTVNAQYNLAPPSLPFTYFVWAAACSLVELDVLTGEVQVLQADIVYDAGDALNPAVDIGQIEGAFITGLGHYLTEDVVYDAKSARLLTRGTWDYHPPSSQDIPLIFNVSLLANATNPAPGSILGSKATAEPPMMLSGSVFFAVKDCIAAYRADQKLTAWFDLAAPASTQAVQLACGITPASLVL